MYKNKKKRKFRKPELEQYKSIWLTENVYKILRIEKKKQRISMAKIVCNLIIKKYKKQNDVSL